MKHARVADDAHEEVIEEVLEAGWRVASGLLCLILWFEALGTTGIAQLVANKAATSDGMSL